MKKYIKKGIYHIILIALIVTAALSICKLYGYYRTYHDGREEYDQLADFLKENPTGQKNKGQEGEGRDKKASCPVTVDFDALKKINPDLVGWIHIPGTGINYPIVHAKDNDTYLNRTFQGKKSYVGAIFLDTNCQPDLGSFNSIIYGHNLKNGEMFGHLKKLYDVRYNSKADYKKHPVIWIVTPEEAHQYKIFAFREIDVRKDRDVYTVELSDPEDRRAFFDKQIKKSQKNTGIEPDEEETMITLSTCTSDREEGRFIVQAVSLSDD